MTPSSLKTKKEKPRNLKFDFLGLSLLLKTLKSIGFLKPHFPSLVYIEVRYSDACRSADCCTEQQACLTDLVLTE